MKKKFRLVLAQLNPTVGDLEKNYQQIIKTCKLVEKKKANLIAFPEMFLTGYQTQDLVLKISFLQKVDFFLKKLSKEKKLSCPILIGSPIIEKKRIYNCYILLHNRKINIVSKKKHLPNTEIFDEKRIFSSGDYTKSFIIDNVKIGCPICEDLWHKDVSSNLKKQKVDLIISPNGSPHYRRKNEKRIEVVRNRVEEVKVPIVYLNMVGGQDDQVFDGESFVVNHDKKIMKVFPPFQSFIDNIDFYNEKGKWVALETKTNFLKESLCSDYMAMVIGLKDYVQKSGFKKVVIGLSGGIDSALVATIAVDALGPKNVLCVKLPSKFSSQKSLKDANDLIRRLGCSSEIISIKKINNAVLKSLASIFQNKEEDSTEENIQSRIRGLILMAISNKFGSMLLTTGNKSEIAVGYSTIYGDMAGGYNPLKDLYKTRVFLISKWRNRNHLKLMLGPKGLVIPISIIEKAPTAELKENQKDEDTLPPYEILDKILEEFIEKDSSISEIVSLGFDFDLVKQIEKLIYNSEYKRYQSAPGPNLTEKSFWLNRRYPIVNKWRDD